MLSLAPVLDLASFQSAQGPERNLEQLPSPTIFLGSSVPPESGCASKTYKLFGLSTNNMLLSLNAACSYGDAPAHEESGATAQYFSFPHSTLSDLEHSLPT